mmetsp:Transcript_10122/g.17085  ORF Transcript_10122/g.17085 Transcript_10122/m.17085 type:complete len:235 (-) Transcript_10122:322-1026(-)
MGLLGQGLVSLRASVVSSGVNAVSAGVSALVASLALPLEVVCGGTSASAVASDRASLDGALSRVEVGGSSASSISVIVGASGGLGGVAPVVSLGRLLVAPVDAVSGAASFIVIGSSSVVPSASVAASAAPAPAVASGAGVALSPVVSVPTAPSVSAAVPAVAVGAGVSAGASSVVRAVDLLVALTLADEAAALTPLKVSSSVAAVVSPPSAHPPLVGAVPGNVTRLAAGVAVAC